MFRADTPAAEQKGSQLTDLRAIEKGADTEELITQRLKLIASLTQVGLHLLNLRADNPGNWEVTNFFSRPVLELETFDPRVMVQNPRAEERNQIDHN